MSQLFPKSITKEKVNRLPINRYDGKIAIISRTEQVGKMLQRLKASEVIGFDTETKPTFKKGQYHHVSLLQLSVPGIVFLVRLNILGLPAEIMEIFTDPRLIKVGIGIRDDLVELQKLNDFEPANVVDLNDMAKELDVVNAGVRNLAAIFLGFRISKSQQTSNWEREELTEAQIRYAATDAWVCMEIYHKLAQWGYID